MNSISHRNFLAIAIPFTISTVTQPLLGAVDTAVVGRLENASYIGGVAIGTVIFNTLYWLFGFLRTSTSGFSAQSLGTHSRDDRYYAYFRPMALGIIVSAIFILLQYPIIHGAMAIYKADPDVTRHAMTYFNILIWGAPFVIIGYVNLGWLMGRKLVKESVFLQVSTNVMNIVLDILFVVVFKMDVAGVAWATLISQIWGFILGVFLISKQINLLDLGQYKARLFESKAMKKNMSTNSNFIIKTISGIIMTNMFVAKGSALGTSFLAANAVLFQIHYIVGYCFDGFANAGSVLVGEAVGENNLEKFKRIVSISHLHLLWMSVASFLILFVFKGPLIACFTDLTEIVTLCRQYMIWVLILCFLRGIGHFYYGFYAGAIYTAPIRNTFLISLAAFVVAYFTVVPLFHNHGLWLAYAIFCVAHSGVLFIYKNKLIDNVFTSVSAGNTQTALS